MNVIVKVTVTIQYPVNMVSQHVGVHHSDGLQSHERDESDDPRDHEAGVFLEQTDRQQSNNVTEINSTGITASDNYGALCSHLLIQLKYGIVTVRS
jgi:hypothetical protein